MKFLPIFHILVQHDYYTDGRCTDVLIEPTPETQRQFRNYRCVLKSDPSGIRVLAAVDDQLTSVIPIPDGTVFTFSVRVQNPHFSLFTDVTALNTPSVPVYTNAGLSAGGDQALIQTARPGEKQTGIRRSVDVVADVAIHNNASLPDIATGPGLFHINFSAKHARWMYYLVTDRNPPASVFQITDTESLPEAFLLMFSPENQTHLNQDPDLTDSLALSLAQQYPTQQRFRFVSDEPVQFQQAARNSLQLSLNGSPLFRALPNPAVHNYGQLTLNNNGSLLRQDVVFHVLKWLT